MQWTKYGDDQYLSLCDGFLRCLVRKLDQGKWLWRVQGVSDEWAVVDGENAAKQQAIAMMQARVNQALSELADLAQAHDAVIAEHIVPDIELHRPVWIDQVSGSISDEEAFGEALELGAEICNEGSHE
jgi:hypothetical protein